MKCDELKADKTFVFGEECEAYKKSEVDAAIEELKREHHKERDEYIDWVNRLQKEYAELKEVYKDSVDVKVKILERCKKEEDELRHHKYKRCLAMADKCAEAYNRECGLNPEEMTDKEFYKQQIEFWPRWNSKWLKIGEKFKDGV